MSDDAKRADEALRAALGDYAATAKQLQRLVQDGTLSQAQLDAVINGALSQLKSQGTLSEADLSSARALLLDLSSKLDTPSKRQN